MTVTAAKRPKGAAKKPINGEVHKARKTFEANDRAAAIAGANAPAVTAIPETPVPIAALSEHPDNPRQVFDPEALAKLAETFVDVGVLSPLLVQPHADGYQILAGARRFRAARLAKLKTVPCKIVHVTEAQAANIMATENLDREDLNPIERARSYKLLLDKSGYTQTTLAARFKITQGQVSHCVRMLDLPKQLQARIASRNITIEQGRELARFAAYPDLCESIDTALGREESHDAESFHDALCEALDKHGRDMATETWNKGHRRFKADADAVKQLDVVMLKSPWGGPQSEWALNARLWDELQEKAIEAEEKRAAKAAAKAADGDGDRPLAKKAPTAAQVQAKQQKSQEQYAKRLYAWKVVWLQGRIVERLKADRVQFAACLKLTLFFAAQRMEAGRGEELLSAIEAVGGKTKGPRYDPDILGSLATVPPHQVEAVIRGALFFWLQHDVENYHTELRASHVEAIAAELGVDVHAEWRLTEDFLALHTKEQLLRLHEEWRLHIANSTMSRKELIDVILKDGVDARAPAALLHVKAPKR